MALVETAAERYKGLLAAVAPAMIPRPQPAALQPAALADVIDEAAAAPAPAAAAPAALASALSNHIAANSQLSAAQAQPLVEGALAKVALGATSAAKGAAVSQALASALPGMNVELSEAAMLNGTVRLGFAITFGAILIACVVGVIAVGAEAHPSETVLITLSVIGVLVAFGVLVLVMGYKKANIKLGS